MAAAAGHGDSEALRPAPVPDTLDELVSPGWLTSALAERYPGIVVTGVDVGPVVSRVATNARFRIRCAGGIPEGLSPDLCAKGYFTEAGRAFRHAGETEAFFYRDIAHQSGIRTLRSVYADVDTQTHHGVIITEDVVPQGATFLDGRGRYSPDQAAESLAQLARLHAATWMSPGAGEAAWLAPRLDSYLVARGVKDIVFNFECPIGAGVPAPVRDAERLADAYRSLAAAVRTEAPWSVVHGDPHVGNVYLDGAGRPCLMDWQLAQRAPWYLDVGYHIASSLDVDGRRRHEDQLLRHYLRELGSAGAEPPGWDDARLGYRRGILHGFYLWGITLKVDPEITSVLLLRLGTAAADHEVLESACLP